MRCASKAALPRSSRCCRRAPARAAALRCRASADSWLDGARAAAVAALSAGVLVLCSGAADAIPQTSACATESCDDNDYSRRDLRKEFYTARGDERDGAARSLLLCSPVLHRSSRKPQKGSLKRAKFDGSNLEGVTLFGADVRVLSAHLARSRRRPPFLALAPVPHACRVLRRVAAAAGRLVRGLEVRARGGAAGGDVARRPPSPNPSGSPRWEAHALTPVSQAL